MKTMSQGAALAEFDLNLRGPGELYGQKQSGARMLKIASFSDIELLSEAKQAAATIFPMLNSYHELKEIILKIGSDTVVPD